MHNAEVKPVKRETMEFDIVIVGAGPSGLSAAIRLAQLGQANNTPLSICIVEKGSEVGAHSLSGAVLDLQALNELFPDWRQLYAPLKTPVTSDSFYFLTQSKSYRLPLPPQMNNSGNFIISQGELCRWLARQAEILGIDIFPGFAASDILYDEQGKVYGITTGDMGVNKDGTPGASFEPGIELHARQVIFAEGCRGSLTRKLQQKFNLRQQADPQTYALGLKEIWEIPSEQHNAGKVFHSIGWPLDKDTFGGSFLYHMNDNQLAVGFVIGLDYKNPHLNPFEEFQRFKNHPSIRPIFKHGNRISYGARALSEGGFQSIPKLTFPGGMLVGDTAGFLNVPKIKGIHTAMKSGMLAAEAIFKTLAHDQITEVKLYPELLKNSWVWQELKKVRNIRPGFHKGLWAGLFHATLETYIFRGKAPWTLHNHADHRQLGKAKNYPTIDYPKPDNKISFDRLSSVYMSNTNHAEDQPVHLKLTDPEVAIKINLQLYDAPEQRYCPAGVYEIIQHAQNNPVLQINAQNCIHCKTCDIKDPTQNITWVVPEGGGGPNYSNM